jgi:hypothetical protein
VSKGNEIEVKFEAEHVEFTDFWRWTNSAGVDGVRFERWNPVYGSDHFWVHPGGGAPIRHRHDDGANTNELTVKARKSQHSTVNRKETNLPCGYSVAQEDVDSFLHLAGFVPHLHLAKKSDIIHAHYRSHIFCFSLYDAWLADRPQTVRRFIEIELEAPDGNDKSDAEGTRILHELADVMAKALNLGESVNYSLFEYFDRVAKGDLAPTGT